MDLTNCMISFGENGILEIKVDKQYIESLNTNVIEYNTLAIPYYEATLNRLKKFEDNGWITKNVYKYIYTKQEEERVRNRNSQRWEGS